MATTITMLDIKTLEQIRKLIIQAMSCIELTLDAEYKLSKIDEDNPTVIFRIQILGQSVTPARVRNAIKHWFDYTPTYQDSAPFMRIDTEKEYDYLFGLKIQKTVG
ncbi:MAG: hypothetical protein JWM92_399 [Candidatus Nomurabacteria bacterium]|nr:hypothetical protein [Candidatus Nomurabacteria bacterium]